MKFDIFWDIRKMGQRCTLDLFYNYIKSDSIKKTAAEIAAGDLSQKRKLPAITWQAWFANGERKNENAHSSGLIMLDVDHIDGDVRDFYAKCLGGRTESELGIVCVHITPSTHGLRVVAKCRAGLQTIAANQKWLAEQLGIETYDDVCKDFARLSFLVPESYFIYIDKSIFADEEPKDVVYLDPLLTSPRGGKESQSTTNPLLTSPRGGKESQSTTNPLLTSPRGGTESQSTTNDSPHSGGDGEGVAERAYQGLLIRDIAKRWLQANGGEPTEGDRNSQLYQAASVIRYICEFNGETLLANLPDYGLPRSEMQTLIKSALHRQRNKALPKSLARVISEMKREAKGKEKAQYRPAEALDYLLNSHACIDSALLPPIFREYADTMPDDFKTAAVMALLPMLGTIGSKLRATYRDGNAQTPSFFVELIAPPAQGKSIIRTLFEDVMRIVTQMDDIAWQRESEYQDKLRRAKNSEQQPERETYLIRNLPVTTSIAALLQRISNACGVHVIAFSDELDNALNSMKRGAWSDLRALTRNAFDNARFGQDFKGENATRCYVNVYYNTLHCGTPKVYSTYYNNTEDGTVTRIIFCSLSDQFCKDMPIVKKMNHKQRIRVEEAIARLNAVTMDDETIREEETWLTDFDFMNKWARKWCKGKQKLAAKYNNRDVDTFMRRSAVVGFRAAMLAWFLWDKHDKDTVKKTIAFGEWVAEYMLWRLCAMFTIEQSSNEIPYYSVWKELDDEFMAEDVEAVCEELGTKSPVKNIVHKWRTRNKIEELAKNSYRKKH